VIVGPPGPKPRFVCFAFANGDSSFRTGYRADMHWIVPTLSGILTGFGLMSIFLQSLNYLVDAYLML
jgi:hypothetical protein